MGTDPLAGSRPLFFWARRGERIHRPRFAAENHSRSKSNYYFAEHGASRTARRARRRPLPRYGGRPGGVRAGGAARFAVPEAGTDAASRGRLAPRVGGGLQRIGQGLGRRKVRAVVDALARTGQGYRHGADYAAGGRHRLERDALRLRERRRPAGRAYVPHVALRNGRPELRARLRVQLALQPARVPLAQPACRRNRGPRRPRGRLRRAAAAEPPPAAADRQPVRNVRPVLRLPPLAKAPVRHRPDKRVRHAQPAGGRGRRWRAW